MTLKKFVYISSPYTLGDVAQNVRKQFEVADELLGRGYLPLPCLYTHFWHMIIPHEYEFWMSMDLEMILRCDCVLRLPGKSDGADREVDFALARSIPVYYSVDQLVVSDASPLIDLAREGERNFTLQATGPHKMGLVDLEALEAERKARPMIFKSFDQDEDKEETG